jgi:hypothetical protein
MKERQDNRMMSARASSLLRKASGGFEPSLADKTKTRAAVARRVAVGVAAGAAFAASAKSAAAAPSIAPAALAPAAPATAAAPVAAGFAGLGFATKLVAAIAIVGTVSAGAVTAHHTRSSSKPSSAPVASSVPVAADMQHRAVHDPAPQQTAVDAPVASAAVAPVAQTPIADLPQKQPDHAPSTPAKIRTTITATTSQASALQTGAENDLIQGAQRALAANDAASALALLNDHAQRFPNGQLAEDRDAERVLALCAVGRQEDAATAAAAFLSAYPNSTSAPCVRSSCANDSPQ